MKFLLIALIPCFLLYSCSESFETTHILNDVESYICNAPDSALNTLNSIKSKKISNKKLLSKYLLLKTIALDKNNINVTEDSLIRPAVLWYERYGDDREKMLAYYYQGRVCLNDNDHNEAVIAFSNAEKFAKICNDDLYLGLIYREMDIISNQTYNYTEELKYAGLSRDYFKKSGHRRHYSYAQHRVAYAYSNLKQFEKSLHICDSVSAIAIKDRDSVLLNMSLEVAVTNLVHKTSPDYEKAFYVLNLMTDSIGTIPNYRTWYDIAYAYTMTDHYDTANNIIMDIESSQIPKKLESALKYIQAEILYAQGKYKQAFQTLQKVATIQDSILYSQLNLSTANVQKDYFKRQAEYDAERLENNKIVIGLIVLSFLITTISITLFWYRKIKSTEREKEIETAILSERVREALSELDEIKKVNNQKLQLMQSVIEAENKKNLLDFRDKINNLYLTKILFLDNIFKQFYSYGTTTAKHKLVYKTVEDAINSVSGDNELHTLEEIVNSFKDNVMKKLRDEFPRFKAEDFKLMCYWYAGFSPTSMCLLMKIDDINDIYKRKSRLKSRIDKSDSPLKEFFLSKL